MKDLFRNLASLPWRAPWGYTLLVYFYLLNTGFLLIALNPFATFKHGETEVSFTAFWASGAAPMMAFIGFTALLCLRALLMRSPASKWSGLWLALAFAVGGFLAGHWAAALVYLAIGLVVTIYLCENRAVSAYYEEVASGNAD